MARPTLRQLGMLPVSPGKLIMLWVWGGLITALMLTDFMGRAVSSAPLVHLLELLAILLILIVVSAVTWHWLGGKESS